MQYWAVVDNNRKGPMSFDELKSLDLKPETLVWREGLQNWVAAKELEELASLFIQPSVPEPVAENPIGQAATEPTPEAVAETENTETSAMPATPPAETQGNDDWRNGFEAGWAAANKRGDNQPEMQQTQLRQPTAFAQEPVNTAFRPNNYIIASIVLIIILSICCCSPFGLLGIIPLVYGTKVKPAFESGDVELANKYSKRALYWLIAAAISGIVFTIIYECFYLIYYIDRLNTIDTLFI